MITRRQFIAVTIGLAAVAFQGRLYVLAGGPTPGGSASAITEILEP